MQHCCLEYVRHIKTLWPSKIWRLAILLSKFFAWPCLKAWKTILNHKHRKLRAQCTLLTISCSARKLMQYSIVVVPMVRRRRKNPLTDAIAICLVLDANFTKRIWHCFQNFKNVTVYTLVQSEKLIPKRQKYRQTVFRVCFQLWTQRCCQNCVLKYFRKSTLPGNL